MNWCHYQCSFNMPGSSGLPRLRHGTFQQLILNFASAPTTEPNKDSSEMPGVHSGEIPRGDSGMWGLFSLPSYCITRCVGVCVWYMILRSSSSKIISSSENRAVRMGKSGSFRWQGFEMGYSLSALRFTGLVFCGDGQSYGATNVIATIICAPRWLVSGK